MFCRWNMIKNVVVCTWQSDSGSCLVHLVIQYSGIEYPPDRKPAIHINNHTCWLYYWMFYCNLLGLGFDSKSIKLRLYCNENLKMNSIWNLNGSFNWYFRRRRESVISQCKSWINVKTRNEPYFLKSIWVG